MTVELAVLLVLSNLGMIVFGAFEAETSRWRKLLKWALLHALTLGLAVPFGHWALSVPVLMGGMGITFHFWWCHRHGIRPLDARPRDRYYALRGWDWPPV